jgi:hypothetical protein
MTIVIAARDEKGKFVMCSDTRATFPSGKFDDKCKKIYKGVFLGKPILIGGSGDAPTINKIASIILNSEYDRPQDSPLADYELLQDYFETKLKEYVDNHKIEPADIGIQVLICYDDKIFVLYSHFQLDYDNPLDVPYFIGCVQDYAAGYFNCIKDSNDNLSTEKMLEETIKACMRYSINCGGEFEIYRI